MIDAIVYNSNTGFTKQYAYSYAVQTKLPIYSIKELRKLKKGSNIIYFSWVLGGSIVKLDRLKKYNIEMVCAVGMSTYSTDLIESLKVKNKLDQVFYLQGGLRLPMLSMKYRMMLKLVMSQLKKKEKQNQLSLDEKEILFYMQNGRDSVDLDALEPLVSWYNSIDIEYVS